jgi:BRCA1 C Terminus (BRCT) domain
VLDEALADRILTAEETAQLRELADDLGLSEEDLQVIYADYLAGMATAAAADGVITDAELEGLSAVTAMLQMPSGTVDAFLAAALTARAVSNQLAVLSPQALFAGQGVVFTGESDQRSELEALATARGLRVTGSTSRKTAVLVTEDAASQSAKARTARELGIPVLTPAAFRTLLADVRSPGEVPASAQLAKAHIQRALQRPVPGMDLPLARQRVLVAGDDDVLAAAVRMRVLALGGTVGSYVTSSLYAAVMCGGRDRSGRADKAAAPRWSR